MSKSRLMLVALLLAFSLAVFAQATQISAMNFARYEDPDTGGEIYDSDFARFSDPDEGGEVQSNHGLVRYSDPDEGGEVQNQRA